MPSPTVVARSYVSPAALDATIAFYERLLDRDCVVRCQIPELQTEIAACKSLGKDRMGRS